MKNKEGRTLIKGEDKEINKKKRKRKHKKKEKKPDEHLSFSDIDYLMRHNRGVDERKCQGRWGE
jgi:hypothetical protein